MSAPARRGRKKKHAHAPHADERWLLTYSDMITLLMALFIVMWSISAVNQGKFDELRASLRAAFTHEKVLDGGPSVLQSDTSGQQAQPTVVQGDPPQSRIDNDANLQKTLAQFSQAADRADLENLRRIQAVIEQYARTHGLAGQLQTSIDERGLVIHLLTDKVLFDTGEAVVKQGALPVLNKIGALLAARTITNPVRVEGNTDDVPIHTVEFRSNWELSTARATAVLAVLQRRRIDETRLSVAGYGQQRPVASNATPGGRRLNRRVDIVVLRHRYAQLGGIG